MKTSLIAAALATATSLYAQHLPTAPIPTPLQGDHKVLIANAGGPGLGHFEKLMTQIFYADVYNGLTAKGGYHPVLQPSDADLLFTLSEPVSSETFNGTSLERAVVRLEISDAKTHALLWALDEPIDGAFREKTFEKNALATIDMLLADLASLSAGKIPADASTAKYDKP